MSSLLHSDHSEEQLSLFPATDIDPKVLYCAVGLAETTLAKYAWRSGTMTLQTGNFILFTVLTPKLSLSETVTQDEELQGH